MIKHSLQIETPPLIGVAHSVNHLTVIPNISNILNLYSSKSNQVTAADSLLRTMSIRAEKAISGQCVSRFTTTRIFAATKEGISNDSIKQFLVIKEDKEAFYVTCIESNPYQRIEDSLLGMFSILRCVADRCRPHTALVLC